MIVRSIIVMLGLSIGGLLEAATSKEPFLKNVRQLTTSGSHWQPRFGFDERFIYFHAQSGVYGSKPCTELYVLDTAHADRNARDFIARVSPGLGASFSSAPADWQDETLVYASTFEQAFDTFRTDVNTPPTNPQNKWYCPNSQCSGTSPNALCAEPHVELIAGTHTYRNTIQGSVGLRLQNAYDPNAFNTQPAQHTATITIIGPGAKPQKSVATLNAQLKDCTPSGGNPKTCAIVGNDPGKTVYTPPGTNGFTAGLTFGGFVLNDAQSRRVYFAIGSSQVPAPVQGSTLISTRGTGIIETSISLKQNTIGDQAGAVTQRVSPKTKEHYIWPHQIGSSQNAPSGFMYTKHRIYKNKPEYTLHRWKNGRTRVITDPFFDTQFGTFNADGTRIVFTRRPAGSGDWQIYVADYCDEKAADDCGQTSKVPKLQPAIDDSKTAPFDTLRLLSHFTFSDTPVGTSEISRVRMSEFASDVLVERRFDVPQPVDNQPTPQPPPCRQLFHFNTALNDFTMPRRLSVGIGSVDGADFRRRGAETRVVYASNFAPIPGQTTPPSTRAASDVGGCSAAVDVCADAQSGTDDVLKNFCVTALTRVYLDSAYELYEADLWGTLTARLTVNSQYDGEPAVNAEQTAMVWTSVTTSGGQVDIKMHNFNDDDGSDDKTLAVARKPTREPKVLTQTHAPGYYALVINSMRSSPVNGYLDHQTSCAPTLSPTSLYAAWHGVEDVSPTTGEFGRLLSKYGVVDASYTDIYVYMAGSKKRVESVFNITDANTDKIRYSRPTFTRDQRALVYEAYDYATKTTTLWRYVLDSGEKTKILDANPTATIRNPRALSFVDVLRKEGTDAVFVADDGNNGESLHFALYTDDIFSAPGRGNGDPPAVVTDPPKPIMTTLPPEGTTNAAHGEGARSSTIAIIAIAVLLTFFS